MLDESQVFACIYQAVVSETSLWERLSEDGSVVITQHPRDFFKEQHISASGWVMLLSSRQNSKPMCLSAPE